MTMKISEEVKVQMPMKTVASLITLVAIGTWAYFGLNEALNQHSTKLELFESAKLHVVTSHSDVHTITAIESLAMGTPVVITKASDFPELNEYKAGITVDLDSNSVYNAVEELLGDEEKLKEYSKNAKKLIDEKFLLKNKIKEYEKMFKETIKKYKKLNSFSV